MFKIYLIFNEICMKFLRFWSLKCLNWMQFRVKVITFLSPYCNLSGSNNSKILKESLKSESSDRKKSIDPNHEIVFHLVISMLFWMLLATPNDIKFGKLKFIKWTKWKHVLTKMRKKNTQTEAAIAKTKVIIKQSAVIYLEQMV